MDCKKITIINDYELMNNETEVRILRGISAVDDPRRWRLVNKKEEIKMEIGKTYVSTYKEEFVPEVKLSDGTYAGMYVNKEFTGPSLVPPDLIKNWTLKKNKKTYWHCIYKKSWFCNQKPFTKTYASQLWDSKHEFEKSMKGTTYTLIKEFETEVEEDA